MAKNIIGNRRKAREAALQLLYKLECSNLEADETEMFYWNCFPPPNIEVRQYASILFKGVNNNIEEINNIIKESSKRWKIERMSIIDRNIIRVAIFEVKYQDEIPFKVAINEAIEIGKKYGTEKSGAFINGLLDKITQDEHE